MKKFILLGMKGEKRNKKRYFSLFGLSKNKGFGRIKMEIVEDKNAKKK